VALNANKANAERVCAQVDCDVRCANCEKVSDWIVDLAFRDNGKVYMKDTNENDLAPVTYEDLRILIKIVG